MFRNLGSVVLVMALVLGLAGTESSATNSTWTGNIDTDWNNPDNWKNNTVPDEKAMFKDEANNTTVTIDQNTNIQQVEILETKSWLFGGSGTLTMADVNNAFYHDTSGTTQFGATLSGGRTNHAERTVAVIRGRLILTNAANDYVGRTPVVVSSAGSFLRVGENTAGLSSSSSLVFAISGTPPATDYAVLETYGAFTRPLTTSDAAGTVRWGGSGGFAAVGGDLEIKLNNNSNMVTWASGGFVQDNYHLVLGSDQADGVVTFTNDLDLYPNNARRTIRVIDNPDTKDDYAVISGRIRRTGGTNHGWDKLGDGLLVLTGAYQSNINELNDKTIGLFGGVLRAVIGETIHTNSRIELNNGAVFESHGAINRNLAIGGDGVVKWLGSGGFSAHNDDVNDPTGLTLNFNGSGQLRWNFTDGFIQTDSMLVFGSIYANRMVELENEIETNSNANTRTIHVIDNPDSSTDFARISGALTNNVANPTSAILKKTGDGILELTAASTYTQPTQVEGGTLRMAATGSLQSTVTVINAGSTLAGTGSVKGFTIDAAALVAPGMSIGTLASTDTVVMNSDSIYAYEMVSPTNHDLIDVTGDLTLNDGWVLRLMDGGLGAETIGAADQFDLFLYTGSLTATTSGFELTQVAIDGSLVPSWNILSAQVFYETDAYGSGNHRVYLTGVAVTSSSAAPIAEPASLGLLGLALLGLRKRRS